jgi:hypothetical protein
MVHSNWPVAPDARLPPDRIWTVFSAAVIGSPHQNERLFHLAGMLIYFRAGDYVDAGQSQKSADLIFLISFFFF